VNKFIDRLSKFLVKRTAVPAYLFDRAPGPDSTAGGITNPMAESVWVMRAIKKISAPIASVPLQFYLGDTEVSDPALAAFWRAPGAGLRWPDFIEATVGWLKLEGEAFWLLDDRWAVPFPETQSSLPPLIVARPDQVRPVMAGLDVAYWEFTDAASGRHRLLPDQVVHLKFWNPADSVRGLSEYAAARIAAETDYLSGKFAKNLAANNGDRGPYVVAESGMPSDAQIKQITEQLRLKRAQQLRGVFSPIFLAGGIRVEDPKVQAPDAAWVASRLENRHEIFLAFGVPPSMADVKASYSIGSASDYFMLVHETCIPTGVKICAAISDLVQRVRRGQPIEAVLDWDEHPVMQAVRNERIDSATKFWDRGMPWSVVNETLDLGLRPFTGWDIAYLPFSVAPAGAEPPEQNPEYSEPTGSEPVEEMLRALSAPLGAAPDPGRNGSGAAGRIPDADVALWKNHVAKRRETFKAYQTAFQRVLFEARAQVLAKLDAASGTQALGHAGATGRAGAAADFMFNLDEFRRGVLVAMRKIGTRAIESAVSQLLEEVGKPDDVWSMPPEKVLNFLADRENKLRGVPDDVFDRIKSELQDGLDAGESIAKLADRIRAEFNSLSKYEALRIAQTETGAAYGYSRYEAMTGVGITRRRWLTSGNANVRPTHEAANGQVRAIDEPFSVGGASLMFPGDPSGPPEEIINCHCIDIALAEKD
jgi:SPP1 gp7 family putative phage head morphogenesis protein